jgi:hypothetical protein
MYTPGFRGTAASRVENVRGSAGNLKTRCPVLGPFGQGRLFRVTHYLVQKVGFVLLE